MEEKASETDEIHDREGRYADAFRIGHSAYKFVLEFGQFSSPKGKTHYHTRIIVGPENARAFFETLEHSLKEYEEQFSGIIRSDE